MPAQAASGLRDAVSRRLSLIFPALLIGAVLVLIAPLPPAIMDLLLAANLTASVLILLTTIYVANPLEFSVFPAILLATTLGRLVLNVASTRLILTGAADRGTAAAGHVIEAFGEFVAAGSPVVGLVIFVIIVTIQFLVITKGATRISEVAARFALDGMPGRQMAVDADLGNGLISRDEAQRRRTQIAASADFYGAMDGAGKFVRGDAVAGLVITLVNIVAGVGIGLFQEGMAFGECLTVFTVLTIGDGLVAQIPAFLVAVAAALVVTRSTQDSDLPQEAVGQLFRHPTALYLAAAFLLALAFTGLPALPLFGLASACALLAYLLGAGEQAAMPVAEEPKPVVKPAMSAQPQDQLRVEPLELELGVGLIRLADPQSGGDLLSRVTQVRNSIAQELGFILPKVRIKDNLRLDPRQFQIKLRDVPVAWGAAYADALLAVDNGQATESIAGIEATHPVTGRPAWWIEPSRADEARQRGYQILDPQAVIVDQLTMIVRRHSDSLLMRQQVHGLLENLRQRSPRLVEELIPEQLKTSHVHQVLCNLLREGVPVRDLETIVETLGVQAGRTRNAALLTESVRLALGRTITQRLRDADRVLHAVMLDPRLEDELATCISFDDGSAAVEADADWTGALVDALRERTLRLIQSGRPAVVVCRADVRAGLSRLAITAIPGLSVVSTIEITADTEIISHGQVRIEEAVTAGPARRGDTLVSSATRLASDSHMRTTPSSV